MVKITRQYPTEQDALNLSQLMRQCDITELGAVTDQTIYETVTASISNSHGAYCWAYFADDRLLCICGCTRSGQPWLLATDELDKHTRRLTKTARREVRKMLNKWPILSNIIDVRSTQTIRWLRSLGFSFQESFEIKPGLPIIRFQMVRDVNGICQEPA